jgi:hypothetical protein
VLPLRQSCGQLLLVARRCKLQIHSWNVFSAISVIVEMSELVLGSLRCNLQQFSSLFRIVHVPFLYVMFARFIMKFSDLWKLPLQCLAVFNSVYACPPVIPPCYVSWYRHVVVTLLMDVCFLQNDGG